MMDKRIAQQKKGLLTDKEIEKIITTWKEGREEEDVDPSLLAKEVKRLETKFSKFNVPLEGYIPEVKEDGVCAFLYCQLNSCSSREIRESKVAEIMYLKRKYDIDVVGMNEIGFNFDAVEPSRGFDTWFEDDRELRAVEAHNKHNPTQSRHRQGGVGIVCFNEMLQYAKNRSKDTKSLGRWCSWAFHATPHHVFRFVIGYSLCKSKPKGLKTIYQQHLRYIQHAGLNTTPQEMFHHDFCKQCRQWRKNGDILLLFLDANEHILNGKIFDSLASDGIDLHEFSHKYWNNKAVQPHTFINGSSPIDGAYKTKELEIAYFGLLPFHESPGDHRSMVVGITTRSMLGVHRHTIIRPISRRLVTSNSICLRRYLSLTDAQFDKHRIYERMDAVEKLVNMIGHPTPAWLQLMMTKLYSQIREIRQHGEKRCRKIMTPAADYSPPIQWWYDRIHAYEALLKLNSGKKKHMDKSRIVKFAKKHAIDHPMEHSEEELRDGLKMSKIHLRRLRRQAKGLRKTHLRDCLVEALRQKRKKKAREIKSTINSEQGKRMWWQIQRVVKDPAAPPLLLVKRMIDGKEESYEGQQEVEGALQTTLETRFTFAHNAPIMNHQLATQLRYLSDREIATQIITGTYDIPTELDAVTISVLEEIGRMGMKLINGEEKEIVITPEEFQRFWKRVNEFTSSGGPIHYGHYRAAANSDLQSKLEAQQLTVVAKSGIPPEEWSVCVQVMLEKLAGVCLVERLRAIQLYDAQFNSFNAFVFGREAMHTLADSGFLPDEHFSQSGSTAEDGKFDKTLMADLSRQARQPMAIASVDASNCYDWVNHVLMSLVWLVLLGTNGFGAIQAALIALQTMRFYQRTGYGESNSFFGGIGLLRYIMGLGQGSRGAPSSWLQISSVIVNLMRREDCGAKVYDPLDPNLLIHTIGALFVDDADLYVWDETYTANELWRRTQSEVDYWAHLLRVTGGALKPEKCFWYLVDYECVDGEWSYCQGHDAAIVIDDLDGKPQPIARHDIHDAKKTLGIHDSPSGDSNKHFEVIDEKFDNWIKRMRNGHLPSHMAWTAYKLQLWPGLRYGIGTLSNSIEAACAMFHNRDYEVLPILGIARTVKAGWRRIHQTFGGFGLFNLPTEQLICRLNLFLQHYHTASPLSKKLDASLRYLQLQLGTNACPFLLDFEKWGYLSPTCWVKMLWQSLYICEFEVPIKYKVIPIPRDRDFLIMHYIVTCDLTQAQISSLNRCRCYLHALFFSDLVTADGRNMESFAFHPSIPNAVNSVYKFPREEPTDNDWEIWSNFWANFTDEGYRLRNPLGKWKTPTHRQWQWFQMPESGQLYHLGKNLISFYIPSTTGRITRSTQRQRLAWSEIKGEDPPGIPVSIELFDEEVRLLSSGPRLVEKDPTMSGDFWDHLGSLGGEWMFENVGTDDKWQREDLSWLTEGMVRGTLTWVADGSYDRKRAPKISGAGWVVHCSATGNILRSYFYEQSSAASSYRGEQLGILAMLHFMLALEEFYNIRDWKGKLCCDNQSALYQASRRLVRIKPSAKGADILRNMRTIKRQLTARLTFEHVDGHMDRILLWHQLTRENQLNCICDQLAKRAVACSIRDGFTRDETQHLPREDIAVVIAGQKQTSDISGPVRYELSKAHAREFLLSEGWTDEQFDEVGWEWLDQSLAGKPDMYRIWLSKQHTNHCATRVQVSYYRGDGSKDVGCPNCGEREVAGHLCICPSEDRTKLLWDMTKDFETWMNKHDNTNPEIAYWVPKYILFRGTKKFADLGPMSRSMRAVAESQDKIGWRNFMEGRVSHRFYKMQHYHLTLSASYLNGSDWMKQFISRILHITHSQWIFRNFTLHDRRLGLLARRTKLDLLAKIEQLIDTPPEEVAEESRFLLEFDFDRLYQSGQEGQEYWVIAMQAAIVAGRRRARRGTSGYRWETTRARRVSRRVRLRIADVERQVRADHANTGSIQRQRRDAPLIGQTSILSFSRRQTHPASLFADFRSNKRLSNPD